MREEWKGFTTGEWAKEVNVRDFIQKNYTPYEQVLHRQQQIYGIRYLIFRNRKEQQAAYLIWIQRLYRQSHHTAQVT